MMRRAFTLVELLVVIGMIAVLMGAMGSSIGAARRRAKIARATQETREMTNAILAYENYAPKKFAEWAARSGGWPDATEYSLSAILGDGVTDEGDKVPILYSANIVSGKILDPWGTPYKFMMKKNDNAIDKKNERGFITAPSLPNFYRLSDEERL